MGFSVKIFIPLIPKRKVFTYQNLIKCIQQLGIIYIMKQTWKFTGKCLSVLKMATQYIDSQYNLQCDFYYTSYCISLKKERV